MKKVKTVQQVLVRCSPEEAEGYREAAVMAQMSTNAWIRTVLADEVMRAYALVHRALPEQSVERSHVNQEKARAAVAAGAKLAYTWAGPLGSRPVSPENQF